MVKARTNRNRPGRTKSSRHRKSLQTRRAVGHAVALVDLVCALTGSAQLIGNLDSDETRQLRRAIKSKNTPYLFAVLMEAFSFQGISDHAACTYMDRHGRVSWRDIKRAMSGPLTCPKLQSFNAFENCGYKKSAQTCAEPKLYPACPLPKHRLRNGRLNQMAYSLFLFIRDVTHNDLVGWIDHQLRHAVREPSKTFRTPQLRDALIEPLRQIFGVSDKTLNMTLAHVLMSAPKPKRLWLETGASMIAIDTLVHNFLHRTGILSRLDSEHAYGPACSRPKGCAEIIGRIARRIDARRTNLKYPRVFPRLVQHAIWRYCAQMEMDICNGNRVDDQDRCKNARCPLFDRCDRIALRPPRLR
jgi:hypothetical protein